MAKKTLAEIMPLIELKEHVIEVSYTREGRRFNIEAISPAEQVTPDPITSYKLYMIHNDRDNGVYLKRTFDTVTEARIYITRFLSNNL